MESFWYFLIIILALILLLISTVLSIISASSASSMSPNAKSFSVYALIVNVIGILLVIFSWFLAYQRGTGYSTLGIGFVITMVLALLFIIGAIILSSFAIFNFNNNNINTAKNFAIYSALVSGFGFLFVLIAMILAIRFGRADIGAALERESLALIGGERNKAYLIKQQQERARALGTNIAARKQELATKQQELATERTRVSDLATKELAAEIQSRKVVIEGLEARQRQALAAVTQLSTQPGSSFAAPQSLSTVPPIPRSIYPPIIPGTYAIMPGKTADCPEKLKTCLAQAGGGLDKIIECSDKDKNCREGKTDGYEGKGLEALMKAT